MLSWSIVVGSIRANFLLKEVMPVICTLVEIVTIYKCFAFKDKLRRIVDCWNLDDASKRTSAQTNREMYMKFLCQYIFLEVFNFF